MSPSPGETDRVAVVLILLALVTLAFAAFDARLDAIEAEAVRGIASSTEP